MQAGSQEAAPKQILNGHTYLFFFCSLASPAINRSEKGGRDAKEAKTKQEVKSIREVKNIIQCWDTNKRAKGKF